MTDRYLFTFLSDVFPNDDAFRRWITHKSALARAKLVLQQKQRHASFTYSFKRAATGDYQLQIEMHYEPELPESDPSELERMLARMISMAPKHDLDDMQRLFELEYVETASYLYPDTSVLCCSSPDPVLKIRSIVLYVKELRDAPPVDLPWLKHVIQQQCSVPVYDVRKLQISNYGVFYVDLEDVVSAQEMCAQFNHFRLPACIRLISHKNWNTHCCLGTTPSSNNS